MAPRRLARSLPLAEATRLSPRSPRLNALTGLRSVLSELPPGTLGADARILSLLVRAWPRLHGASADEMTAEQLASGVRELTWSPPVLSFVVTRSNQREQPWQVDVQDATVWSPREGRRELPPKEEAAELARRLVAQIVAGTGSLAIVRKLDGAIAVRPGEVPGLDVGFAETRVGRHRRFRASLEQAMAAAGFRKTGPYRFSAA